ncbi:uncharacterized protein EI97DRAFT_368244 [Westerdykella ornata]|uniref:C2H2-type domain-containing protein n=1 Tax=Westerdykella ornata TaxID=318751 RepID=A0A6A6JVH9_WESOR|nr:uncharacterized protein EI97DRAFT_368244 [Westerdykella ornata]KAF2280602.1 hypothetical protein EI97DRAFT_368244 [Westerdykella ornata]
MPIPRAREEIPPPLPPPRNIGSGPDLGWQFGNTSQNGFANIKPGSSLLGTMLTRSGSKPHDDMSSDSLDGPSDEDRSMARPSLSSYRLTSERQLEQKTLENSSQAYDKQLLSKIGGPNTASPITPTRTSAPSLSVSAQDVSNISFNRRSSELRPLSLPERPHRSSDSPIVRCPPSATLSPGYSGFRSPVGIEAEPFPRRFGSISAVSYLEEPTPLRQHRGSCDFVLSDSDLGMDDTAIRDLNIRDRSPAAFEDPSSANKAGQKRRASSPPVSESMSENRTAGVTSAELFHRRSIPRLNERHSPMVSRFPVPQGPASAASSLSQYNSSFASSFAFSGASSMTSYNGDQRHSPGALSPLAEAESGSLSPYTASRPGDSSWRGSISRPHQRPLHDYDHRKMSTDSVFHSRHSSVCGNMSGPYQCDCCPKKPRKFETEAELEMHRAERQFKCAFCPNRFKNKNEMERHQQSIHIRRYSWSCIRIPGIRAAFSPSPCSHGTTDVCGYCGEEFPNPPNWTARQEHVSQVHKTDDASKCRLFWRTDHFRQHLKHTHAGTSGKWTNSLEAACIEERAGWREELDALLANSGASTFVPPTPIDEVCDES